MTPDVWAIIGTGVLICSLIIVTTGRLGAHIERVERGQAELRERMAKLEGLPEGLREAISGRRAA